jgi:hypothetical protein
LHCHKINKIGGIHGESRLSYYAVFGLPYWVGSQHVFVTSRL